ncbi:hypothetical protein Tco_1488222, partial [Tanacetum coccineum]
KLVCLKGNLVQSLKVVFSKGYICYRMFDTTHIDEAVAFGAERRAMLIKSRWALKQKAGLVEVHVPKEVRLLKFRICLNGVDKASMISMLHEAIVLRELLMTFSRILRGNLVIRRS